MPKRVVCIEDEPEMIDLLRLILTREGYEFIGARGGMRGLLAVQNFQPDIVLLDLMMPDMDGWQVYDRLKRDEKTRQIPVIIVTARAQSDAKLLEMRVSREAQFIMKPFSAAQLVELMRKMLSQA